MNSKNVILAAGLAATLGLSGCGTASESSGGGSSTEGSTSASSVSLWLDDNVINPCFTEVVKSTWPDSSVTLEIELRPDWDTLTKTAVAGGAGPDLIMTPGVSYTAVFAQSGALAPLEPYAEQYGWADFFAPWSLALGETNGTLYSLQGEQEAMVIWYNKTLFNELGEVPPKTVSELAALADRLYAAGIQPFASGNTDWQGVNEWLLSGILNGHAGGAKFHSALSGADSFTDIEFVEATNLLNSWMQKGYIAGGLDRYYTTTIDEYLAELSAGTSAMNIEGTWRFENIDEFFAEAGQEWDWMPFPSPDGSTQFSIGTGSSWAINANSSNPDGAAALLNHIFTPDVQAQLAVDCGFSPGPVKIDPADLVDLDPRQSRLYVELAEAAEAGTYGYLSWSFFGPKTNTFFIQEIEKVWAGTMTAESYLEGLNALHQQELAAGETPPLPDR